MLTLPNYPTEPGIVGDLTDLIMDRAENTTPNDARRIPWVSSYQGETDYQPRSGPLRDRRLSFRYAKVPWRWSYQKPNERYWNYETEDRFQREVNGAWGIVHRGANPLDAETLEWFRQEYVPLAVTGYLNFETGLWTVCAPTLQELCTESWRRWKAVQTSAAA